MLITLSEIFSLLIATIVIGYIFTGIVTLKPLKKFTKKLHIYRKFSWQDFKLACLVSAHGIILHELAHKFTAQWFGFQAEFHIFAFGLLLAVFLRMINSPFLIIAPGYVGLPEIGNDFVFRLIALVGPLVNLLIWLACYALLKNKSWLKRTGRKTIFAIFLTKRINGILFIFNMLPFPPLDGAKVFFGL